MDVGEDELRLLKMRKMLELQRRLLAREAKALRKEPDYYRVFSEHLTDDGKEMFKKALSQYPQVARRVAEALGRLFVLGRIRGMLDARTVYGVFYEIGYPIRLETRIVYKKRGKVKTISELLKEED